MYRHKKIFSVSVAGKTKQICALGILMLLLNLFFFSNVRADEFTVTAYCSCQKCCDKDPSDEWYGITAIGVKARWGTVAVDREVIKLGSVLVVQGFPSTIFRAEDVGGAIEGKHIDIWFSNHNDALDFGVQKRDVYCVEEYQLPVLTPTSVIKAMSLREEGEQEVKIN
ncbi:MAG: 3D domain-containing protein [Candidatus Scalindua sp.]|nr:3D domain-containing protein [Candidatus Scalindua sp.]